MPKSGIVFLKTHALEELKEFYINRIDCEMWMDQGDCAILSHGEFLFGFCTREKKETDGMLTFVYDSREDVDTIFEKMKDISTSTPYDNPKYPIYHFFGKDPEGRAIEFQVFL